MKTFIKKLFLLPALIAGISLMPASRVTAQTVTILHNFTGVSEGASPWGGLVLSGDTLYGTTAFGATADWDLGTVFAVKTNGTGFMNLHSFTDSVSGDGVPAGELILSGNTLYGTTMLSGGEVFAINTNGTGFTIVHSFTGSAGSQPHAGVILSGGTLYGTTISAGNGGGTVFKGNTDGTGFVIVHNFAPGDYISDESNIYTNSDGTGPNGELILSGNTLYGTALGGGLLGKGTVFRVETDGTCFTNLHDFTGGSDGAMPEGGLVLSGNTLYGTTGGTVFAIKTDGTGFTTLHSFTGSDGSPHAGLILSDTMLYGTTSYGKVFGILTNGTGYTVLHHFIGDDLYGRLVLSGNTLYGTTSSGGTSGKGTVFSLALPPCGPAILDKQDYVGIEISGTVGCSYTIEWTADIANNTSWSALTSLTLTTSPYFYQNPTPTSVVGSQYYQAVTTMGCQPANLLIKLFRGLTVTGTAGCSYKIEWRHAGGSTWLPLTTNISPYFYLDTDPTHLASDEYQVVLVP